MIKQIQFDQITMEVFKYTGAYGIRKKSGRGIAFFIEASDEDDYCRSAAKTTR